MIQLPLIPEFTTITTINNSESLAPGLGKLSLTEDEQLDIMYAKIQELLLTDVFAAQVLYERYKRLAESLPPPTPL